MTHQIITIPGTIKEATAALGGLGRLLTAKEWERAAIVYAFTEPGEGGRGKTTGKTGRFSCSAFARLGIAGLRDEETVAWVRQAWQEAAGPVRPGETVDLPDRDFPKHPRSRSAYDGFAAQVRKNPEALRDLVRDEPELISAVAEQIAQHPGLRTAVEARVTEIRERLVDEPVAPPKPDYDGILQRAVDQIMVCLRAEQRGSWQPSGMAMALLHFVAQMITERSQPDGITDDLFGEIEQYLREGASR